VAPRAGVFQFHPAVAVGPRGELIVAWNEIADDGKRVVVAQVRTGER
jgi:hypothetical protein